LLEDFNATTFANTFANAFDEIEKLLSFLPDKGLAEEITKSSHIAA
jgi:hypothetical protein